MSNNYGPRIVTDGLVLCLDAADQNSYSGSGNTWTDLSGNGYTATKQGGTTFLNNNAGIFDFDGTDDYFNTNFNITGNTNITFSCWVQIDDVSDTVIADNSTGATGFGIRIGAGVYSPFGYGAGAALVLTSNISLLQNTWYNIVTIYTPNRIDSYINLQNEYITGNMPSIIEDTTNDMRIGVRADATDYDFDGRISNILVYNKALTNSEIRQNFEATKGRFGL